MIGAPSFASIVLAAGGSRRLGMPKQLVEIDGEPLIRRAVRAAIAAGAVTTHVVVGADGERVFAAVRDLPVLRVDCADWRSGMGASLRAGIGAVVPLASVDAALVLVCDQPQLTAAHLRALVTGWRQSRGVAAVATRYDGVLAVPAVFPRTWFGALALLSGDRGARELLRGEVPPSDVLAVDAGELARDVDTPEDLRALGGDASS